jgi:bifunctional DNase/RNase
MHDDDGTTTSATELLSPETHDLLQMIKEPETRPISSNKIIAEVKGIYAGLIMVEAKCCEIDAKQHQAVLAMDINTPILNNEQWYAPIISTISIAGNVKLMKYRQALIAPHRTLLHEHHEFFLASQTQSAGAALKKLAPEYSMPARMWCHGIHSFLELLRHRSPHSLEHMLTFIYLAYSMMALRKAHIP